MLVKIAWELFFPLLLFPLAPFHVYPEKYLKHKMLLVFRALSDFICWYEIIKKLPYYCFQCNNHLFQHQVDFFKTLPLTTLSEIWAKISFQLFSQIAIRHALIV